MSNLFNSDPGSSKSNSTQSTSNIDGRVVGGDQSSNLSVNGNGGPVNITTTDAGAVQGALTLGASAVHDSLNLALQGIEGANQNAQAATASNASVLSGALSAISDGQQQFTSAIEQIKTGDKTTGMVVAGFVVVAVVIAAIVLKKKAA